jgi:hypothetical protein
MTRGWIFHYPLSGEAEERADKRSDVGVSRLHHANFDQIMNTLTPHIITFAG